MEPLSHLPARHVAVISTRPAGISSANFVNGSCMGTMPVSSKTVAMHMVLEPDIGGDLVGSMMIAPAAQSDRVDGTIRFTWRATDPPGALGNRRSNGMVLRPD